MVGKGNGRGAGCGEGEGMEGGGCGMGTFDRKLVKLFVRETNSKTFVYSTPGWQQHKQDDYA